MTNTIPIKSKPVQRKFLAGIKSHLSDPKNTILNSLSYKKYGDLITTDEETLERLAYSEFETLKSSYKYKKIKGKVIAFSAYIQHEEIKGVRFDGRDPNSTRIKRVATARLNKGDVFDPIKNVLHKDIFYLELDRMYYGFRLEKEWSEPIIITSTEVQVIDGKTYPVLLITHGYSNTQNNQDDLILVNHATKSHSQYISTVTSDYLEYISKLVQQSLEYSNDMF